MRVIRRQHLGLCLAALLAAGCPGSTPAHPPGPEGPLGPWPDLTSTGDGPRDGPRPIIEAAPLGERRADTGGAVLPAGVTLFVNLGDSLAAGYYASAGHSYRALLWKNDDLLYPAFAGKDLQSRFPGIIVVDRAKSGARTADVVLQAQSVPGNPTGNTLVVVSAGGNDFNDKIETMINPAMTATAAQQAVTNLGKVAARFASKTLFPGKVTLVLLTVFDPTDETGNIPLLPGLTGLCTTIQKFGLLVGPLAVKNLQSFNQALAGLAASPPWALADNHAGFLGHGFHHNDPGSLHYQASDPTLWFHTDCAHGNDRGHHEIRRLLWRLLFGP